MCWDSAIAQAVSRWLPTATARVRARFWSCGICGGQSGAAAGFLRVLRCPLPIFIPPISPQSPSSIIWGWYSRPVVAAVPSGLSLTPLTIIKNKKLNMLRPSFNSRQGQGTFLYSTASRPALGATQPRRMGSGRSFS
jgi:hypothetical protein